MIIQVRQDGGLDDEGGRRAREKWMCISLGYIVEVELMGLSDVWNVTGEEIS